ncbi:YqzM family protein [Paenibacillus sp. y28]
MNNANHPELHVNEEPRNDLMDTGIGFGVTFGIFLVIAVVFTVVAALIGK